ASSGVYDLNAARIDLFGGRAEGTLRADFTRPVPRYQLRASLPGFRVERFLGAVGADSMGAGTMDFAASLSLTGRADSELVRSADGWCSLRGSGLVLRGTDLDGAISHFESSRSFHLVDIGAVLLVGPLGLAVTKGYDYAKLFLGVGDSTAVPEFVSRWRVEHGVAHATDAAFVTPKHRLALQGGLDFAGGRFDDLTVAVVNDKGCAELKQTIHGPFAAPEVDKPDVFSALLGPVEGIARTAKDLLPFTDCTPFYTGSVAPPGSEHGSR
ncbi:MAG: AsmA-like C-terminal region-containing protein, partial [Hyphomicrobiales bacterium]